MGEMVLAFCLGMQNTNNTDYLKTVTNHKHFVANNFESVVRQSKSCLKFYN
jgi:beta-glucosidase-like glycosyl hydrolase